MAFTKDFTIDRVDVNAILGTTSTGRGIVINGQQVELIKVKKSTGDTTGNVTLSAVHRPKRVIVLPLTDSSAVILTAEPTMVDTTFTHTDDVTIALSGLGDWTAAYLFVLGRSYTY